MPAKIVVAMGYAEDGWNSSRLLTEQLAAALAEREIGKVTLFIPRLGHRPRWWDRRLFYPKLIPKADLVQFMDQSYADSLLALPKKAKSVALILDINFWRTRRWWNAAVRKRIREGLARADRRVAISEATAREVRDTLGLPIDRVIAPGFDLEVFAHSGGARRAGALLHVGTTVERKGIDRALRLLASLPASFTLRQVGGRWSHEQRQLIDRLGVGSRVRQDAEVGRDALVEAYRSSAALIFPSRYEGFGLPVIEARLVGTPVWVSSTTPAVEQLEGDEGAHVIDFSAFDEAGKAADRLAVVETLLGDVKPVKLGDRKRFSWSRVAREFARLYEALLP